MWWIKVPSTLSGNEWITEMVEEDFNFSLLYKCVWKWIIWLIWYVECGIFVHISEFEGVKTWWWHLCVGITVHRAGRLSLCCQTKHTHFIRNPRIPKHLRKSPNLQPSECVCVCCPVCVLACVPGSCTPMWVCPSLRVGGCFYCHQSDTI